MKSHTDMVFDKIRAERQQQADHHDDLNAPADWVVILMEEIGEMCRAILQGRRSQYRTEMLQAAAVLVAMCETELREIAYVRSIQDSTVREREMQARDLKPHHMLFYPLGIETHYVTVSPEAKQRLMDEYGLTEADFITVEAGNGKTTL